MLTTSPWLTATPSTGFFCVTGHPMIAELFTVVGADFVVIDMEAGAIDKSAMLACLQAMTGSDSIAIVRVPWLERHWIEHALDVGAQAVLVPKVDTVAEAEAAVAAAFFPPLGRRGLNPVRASRFFTAFDDYLRTANEQTSCFVQIESAAAVGQVDEIAGVVGLTGLFIGTGDLAADLGHPGVLRGADMSEARARVLAACRRHALVPGIFAYDYELAREYTREGFGLIAVGNDIKLLATAAAAGLAEVRGPRLTSSRPAEAGQSG